MIWNRDAQLTDTYDVTLLLCDNDSFRVFIDSASILLVSQHGRWPQPELWRRQLSIGICRPDMELGHWVTGSMDHLGHLSRPGHRVTGSSF